jgi:AraC family transcriptional regulator
MSDGSDMSTARMGGDAISVDLGPGGVSGAAGFRAATVSDAPAPVEIGRGGLPGWRLRRVVDFMTENLGRDIGIEELVSRCGLSRAQFFRAFRQSTGQTPHRYLVGLRLDRAKMLLETEDLSVGEVTRAVGMGANAGFARLFQQRFGAQPARYRRTILAASARRGDRLVG